MQPTRLNVPSVPPGFDAFSRWFEAPFKKFAENYTVWLAQGAMCLASSIVMGVLVVGMLFLLVPGFLSTMLAGILHPYTFTAQPNFNQDILRAEIPAIIGIYIVVIILGLVMQSFLYSGMAYTALKQLRGEPTTFADLFQGGYAWPALMGGMFLAGLMLLMGALCCLLPALFLAPFFIFLVPAAVDQRLGAGGSLSASFEIVKRNYWLFFVYMLVFGAMVFAIQMILQSIPLVNILFAIVFPIVLTPFQVLVATVPYAEMHYGDSARGPIMSGLQAYMPPAYAPPHAWEQAEETSAPSPEITDGNAPHLPLPPPGLEGNPPPSESGSSANWVWKE